jgi:hypothetical protein
MAILALNVREVCEVRIIRLHVLPIGSVQICREGPTKLSGDIVKAPVHCVRVGIITHRVTGNAVLAVMTRRRIGPAVDFSRELGGVQGV